jgi:enoyl-CoA hydratase
MSLKGETRFDFQTISCEVVGASILVITLNRPEASNALNTQMARDLLSVFEHLLFGELLKVRCIVMTGSGSRAFCAGGDLKERDGMSDADWRAQHVVFEQMFRAVMECSIPVIAAVNGAAYGGGCELALACDFIYVAESAVFSQPETRLGIIPGGGGTQTLARAVGAARAKEIILSGRPFEATQAFSWGMVNNVVPDSALLDEVLTTARVIAANAPIAVRQAKLAITNGSEVDRRSGLIIELAAYNQTVPTADRREGIRAAIEHRDPKFTGL